MDFPTKIPPEKGRKTEPQSSHCTRFLKRLLFFFLRNVVIQGIAIAFIPVINKYHSASFASALIHVENGIVAASLLFIHPFLSVMLTLLLIVYQLDQTYVYNHTQSSDLMAYALGYAVVGIVNGFVIHLWQDPPKRTNMVQLYESTPLYSGTAFGRTQPNQQNPFLTSRKIK